MSDIKAALESLDAGNDDHWTSDGLPRVDVVEELVGSDVTRADLKKAAPEFTRTAPNLPGADSVPASNDAQDAEADDDKAKALARMEKAEKALSEAKAEHRKAYNALTAINKAEASNQPAAAANVKAYQDSQRKQREEEAGRNKALGEFLKNGGKAV